MILLTKPEEVLLVQFHEQKGDRVGARPGDFLPAAAFRGVGLGTMLVNQFIDIGRENGLRHLSCMLISDLEADAVKTLQDLGFDSYVVKGYGTDPDGNQHDMTKLVLKL